MKRALPLLLALALCLGLSAPALAEELSDAAAPEVEFSDVPASYAFRQAILDCVERASSPAIATGPSAPAPPSPGPSSAPCWPGPSTPGRTRPTPV